ncbi:unnamed protein product [Schistosoma guineensis]|nr:unnamed protein product [Schistosoma guineensis]
MTVCNKKVLLFGEASELVGCKEITIQFPVSCTNKTLKDIIIEQLVKLEPLKDSLTVAIDWEYTDINTSNSQYFIKISIEPIEYSNVFDLINDSSIGAVSTFFGITRKYDQERIVQALKYECYLKMTYLEMEKIIKNSYQLWPSLVHIIVLHRYGIVTVGEISVAIAVSSPHRKDSLDAVKYLIESIKSQLPIWKKEIYEDGTFKWKRNNECFWLQKEK